MINFALLHSINGELLSILGLAKVPVTVSSLVHENLCDYLEHVW